MGVQGSPYWRAVPDPPLERSLSDGIRGSKAALGAYASQLLDPLPRDYPLIHRWCPGCGRVKGQPVGVRPGTLLVVHHCLHCRRRFLTSG